MPDETLTVLSDDHAELWRAFQAQIAPLQAQIGAKLELLNATLIPRYRVGPHDRIEDRGADGVVIVRTEER